MSVLFLHTTPPPILANTDAVFQEVQSLKKMMQGEEAFLFPWKKPLRLFPRALLGWHQISRLKKLESKTRVTHLFSPILYYYPILSQLKNPIVYSISASLNRHIIPGNLSKLKTIHKIIISNKRDQSSLQQWGLQNYRLVHTGINTSHIHPHSKIKKDVFVILMASAPWVYAQFETKGIDLLLQTIRKVPFLRIKLLWRGMLESELQKRIKRMQVEKQVEVINRQVNIQEHLEQVHATILLAKTPDLVKAFPHSLIESLAAGKPIITSEAIPMADYIRQNQVGQVLKHWNVNELVTLITTMKNRYSTFQTKSLTLLANDFSDQEMLRKIKDIYDQIIKA